MQDVFGIYPNSQLLADSFAAQGYLTVLPDYFRGAPLVHGKNNDIQAFLKVNQPEHIEPVIEAALNYTKKELGAKKIGAVGYCFGGKV